MDELKKGEMICDKCEGKGTIPAIDHFETGYRNQWGSYGIRRQEFPIDEECPKCFGVGKLDWIEAVVGKKPKFKFINRVGQPIFIGGGGSVIGGSVS